MSRRRKPDTPLPLFDEWGCPQEVRRFDPVRVRGATLQGRLSRGVSETLKEARVDGRKASRTDVARAMSQWLGTSVSAPMLNKYASVTSEDHEISLSRALALMVATGDHRLLAMMVDEVGLALVPKRYGKAAEELQERDRLEELERELTDLYARVDRMREGRRG